jgi:hypothetical protein
MFPASIIKVGKFKPGRIAKITDGTAPSSPYGNKP